MKNDWIKIKNYYLTHEISLKELADKFGKKYYTVKDKCSKEKWGREKAEKHAEISQKSCQRMTEREINKKVAANTLHSELYDKGLEVAELLLNMYLQELKSGKKTKKATAYNLDFVMKAIAAAQKGQRLALNIDDKDVLKDVEPEIAVIQGISLDKI